MTNFKTYLYSFDVNSTTNIEVSRIMKNVNLEVINEKFINGILRCD